MRSLNVQVANSPTHGMRGATHEWMVSRGHPSLVFLLTRDARRRPGLHPDRAFASSSPISTPVTRHGLAAKQIPDSRRRKRSAHSSQPPRNTVASRHRRAIPCLSFCATAVENEFSKTKLTSAEAWVPSFAQACPRRRSSTSLAVSHAFVAVPRSS